VRVFAVEALGLIREDRAAPKLRDLIARADGRDTEGLVLALARIGAPDDLPTFRQLLAGRSAGVRRAGAEGIGRAGDTASIDALEKVLAGDREASVRLAAAFALQRLGRTQSHVIAAGLAEDDEYVQARDYLFELGRAAVPGLHAALEVARTSRHRADLIQAIGHLGSPDDLAILQAFLADRDERVQRAATSAVLRLKRAG
jgi:HEAT repeat protein